MRFEWMNRVVRAMSVILLVAIALFAGLQSPLSGNAPVRDAQAVLRNADGDEVGWAYFQSLENGVRIVVEVRRLPPGIHGMHLHDVGRCDPPGFKSAGSHLNPGGREHGEANPRGPHAGDLPNLNVKPDGSVRYESTTRRTTMDQILDADGSALVIHAQADDYRTDPAGQSGDRIVCGVIEATLPLEREP